jgi:hypothetical protein
MVRHGSLQQGQASADIKKMITDGNAAVTSTFTATNDHLNTMTAQLSALQLAAQANAGQRDEWAEVSGALKRGIARINSIPRVPPGS